MLSTCVCEFCHTNVWNEIFFCPFHVPVAQAIIQEIAVILCSFHAIDAACWMQFYLSQFQHHLSIGKRPCVCVCLVCLFLSTLFCRNSTHLADHSHRDRMLSKDKFLQEFEIVKWYLLSTRSSHLTASLTSLGQDCHSVFVVALLASIAHTLAFTCRNWYEKKNNNSQVKSWILFLFLRPITWKAATQMACGFPSYDLFVTIWIGH